MLFWNDPWSTVFTVTLSLDFFWNAVIRAPYAFLGTGSDALEPKLKGWVFFVVVPPPVEHAASSGMVAAPTAPVRRTRLSTVVFAILRNALTVSVGIVLLLLRNSNGQGNSRQNTSGAYINSQIRTKLSMLTHSGERPSPPD